MASRVLTQNCQPGDVLLVVHDFKARSVDELSLSRGDKIVLIERDDDFGDGWFLGKHLDEEISGLFPEVYTTPAPKSISAAATARRVAASQIQPPQDLDSQKLGTSEASSDDTARAPPVQPFVHDISPGTDGQSAMTSHTAIPSIREDRAVSNPLPYASASPSTPPSIRGPPISAAQRSISISNGIHQNSPVMNETLSVIEEHITDMSTPRHSLLAPDRTSKQNEERIGVPVRRLSYINGHETDEEESGMLSEQEVREWDPERVAEYLEDLGVAQEHCNVFREQEISGDVLLGMDQGSLMLKEFELGSIGKRLALWQKIKAIQEEVRIARAVPRLSSDHSPSETPFDEPQALARNRSTSVGLPRIPSLMEGSNSRVPSRQLLQRIPSHQSQHRTESLSSLPVITREDRLGHEHRPSAQSVRSLQHNRRHSSIDQTEQTLNIQSQSLHPASPSHKKNGSFDRSWTMGSTTQSPTDLRAPTSAGARSETESIDPMSPSFSQEAGLTVVNSIDLDKGYFSESNTETRKPRNVLRKKQSPSHSREPSDSGYSPRRLSGVFRQNRAGSTDSLYDSAKTSGPSALQSYYGSGYKSNGRAASGPIGKSWRNAAPIAPPTVTKLDYSQSPSIDAIASGSPNIPGSETSSIERPVPSPAAPGKTMFSKSRVTGLRAISDAITGDERRDLLSPTSDKSNGASKDSPLHSPSRTETGSSTPSITSKSTERDDSSFLQNGTSSSGRHTPLPSATPKRKGGKKTTSAYTRGLEKKSPKEQMEGCDYSGWMKKKSSTLMTTWKTRLFVLRGRRLSYYYTEDDTEEKGLIDISFHRVLPATNDRITGLHATVTRANASPTSPNNSTLTTAASTAAKDNPNPAMGDAPGMFIFKLVPPRIGLSKAVNFTKPTVHYFAVDNVQQGRLWMAALMKATIDRDEGGSVVTTYKEKTISLAKAKAMRQRPPALMGDDEIPPSVQGLGVDLEDKDSAAGAEKEREGSLTTSGTQGTNSTVDLEREGGGGGVVT
ncbi:hypothetical protein EJ08DRAFT_661098 [Tothia fuscella]|uniref:Uncharacterized protein n=1 Tax=Tothia fuscella TaxID=1048955 RepID=A0A9P4NR05_9PEZI|nr:hypothetical protein EJ08DRAFT_661098 [Tothia fuscella]